MCFQTKPSLCAEEANSWVCLSNDSDEGEVVVAEIPSSLTEKDIEQRVRMARLSASAELRYRQTLQVLELTTQGKHAKEISDIMGIDVESVRNLRSGMRETVASVEKKIDEFVANPGGSEKRQKSVSKSACHSSKSKVEPYRETVEAMLKGGKSHWVIHEELCRLGFSGSHSTVDNYIIKLRRESSIDKEMEDARIAANDYFVPPPERPERISVRVYSAKTVYNRVLARVRELRQTAGADENQGEGKAAADSVPPEKKTHTPFRQTTG